MEQIILYNVINNEYNARNIPNKYMSTKYNQFTNFMLKHMAIVNRMIITNKIIQSNFNYWKNLQASPTIVDFNTDKLEDFIKMVYEQKAWQTRFLEYYYEQENLIINLRKIVDDCISLYSIMTDAYIKNRPIDSIGEALDNKNKFDVFNKHFSFFETLNNFSNGFKHCTANTIGTELGKGEPCIFCYYNDRKSKKIIHTGITVNQLIKDFNSFYLDFDSVLKNS